LQEDGKIWYFSGFFSITNCSWISRNYLPMIQLNLCKTHGDMRESVAGIRICPKWQFLRSRLRNCQWL
jgi:hypothetical protein